MARETYCDSDDLLTGSIPTPTYLAPLRYVEDAADEIDSMIGFVYSTPVDISTEGDLARPARLLLKRLNSHLASGRLIMAAAAPGEQSSLHAYGYSLVKEALTALQMIASGDVKLEGAPPASEVEEPTGEQKPVLQYNKDARSFVDDFYDGSPQVSGLYFGSGYRR